jgi:uncharacterized protein (TIGR03437 family)
MLGRGFVVIKRAWYPTGILLIFAARSVAQSYITTYAGTDFLFPAQGKPGLQAPLGEAYGLASDARGNVYIPDARNHMVLRLSPDGILDVAAGNGLYGFSGDGGPARNASLDPAGVAIDSRGNLFIADPSNYRIRRVTADGIITTAAGNGSTDSSDGPALQVGAGVPGGLAVDAAGNLYFYDFRNLKVRMLTPAGELRTVAGNGRRGFAPDGTNALQAPLSSEVRVAVDSNGRLLLAEADNHRVRAIEQGVLRTVAGTGQYEEPVNGPATNSPIPNPSAIAVDGQGNIYVGVEAYLVRISAGRLTIIAGDGEYEYRGDGRRATAASLSSPYGLTVDPRGIVYFADELCLCVRMINTSGIVNTVAGNAALWRSPDGTPATRAILRDPAGIAFDTRGNLLIANRRMATVAAVSPAGTFSTVAGSLVGHAGDGGPAKDALLDSPAGIAVDSRTGRVFISDRGVDLIRMIDANGIISTYAGNPRDRHGYGGDNGPASLAKFSRPHGMVVDAAGNLYIADRNNHRVRVVTPDRNIRTYAGDGQDRYFGDGRSPLQASLREPVALAFTPRGELLIADFADNRIRVITSQGIITTFAGTGQASSSGDGGPATQASFLEPSGLAVDGAGNVFVLETGGNRVRRIDTSGIVTTVAGTGARGFSGDGGSSLRAQFDSPQLGIAVNREGDVFIADTNNGRIRVLRSVSPRLSLNRTAMQFSVPSGEMSPALSVAVQSDRPGVIYTFTSSAEWLRFVTKQSSSPQEVQLEISVDATQLAPGTYTGTIRIASEVTQPRNAAVDITATVTQPRPPQLDLPTLAVTLEAVAGESASQTLTVGNIGGGELRFRIEGSAPGVPSWLEITPVEGVARASSAASVNLHASAASLIPGTYSTSIRVVSGETEAAVTVTFAVRERSRPKLLVSQSGLLFECVAKGGSPAAQRIGILNEGAGEMTWTASARTLSGGDWLALTQTSGRVDRPLLDVSFLEASVRHQGLTAGDYYGKIEIQAPSDNSPQTVSVLLRVLPEGSNPGPDVQPAGLIFTGVRGTNPGAQFVTVTNLLPTSTEYVSSRLAFGEEVFTHSPTQSTVAPDSPTRIVVQPDYRNLAPGVRQGLMTLFFADGRARSVNVLTVVAPDRAEAGRALGVCPSDNLRIEFTSLRDGFIAVVGEPTTIEVKIVDECGNFFTPQTAPNSAIQIRFSNQDPPIRPVHLGEGTWTATWRPLRAAEDRATVEVNLYLNVANRIRAFDAVRTGSVRAGSRSPVVRQGSLRHSATFETQAPVAPGQLVSVLGGNLAEREDRVDQFPLPRELGQTEVLIGGRSLPLLFTSEGQINAQVPYDLPVNTQHQLIVRRGATLSVPEQFVVAAAVPGIFTRNERGFGQGAIFRTDGSRAEPGTPARKGEEVIIYCTGLGAVNPPVEPGDAAPDPPPDVIAEVGVTIGGVRAEVKAAALSPGVAGRYQIRVIVPEQTATGDEVPVVVTAGGRSSPSVTMAVSSQ